MEQLWDAKQPLHSLFLKTIIDVDELMHSLNKRFNVVTVVHFWHVVQNQIGKSLRVELLLSANELQQSRLFGIVFGQFVQKLIIVEAEYFLGTQFIVALDEQWQDFESMLVGWRTRLGSHYGWSDTFNCQRAVVLQDEHKQLRYHFLLEAVLSNPMILGDEWRPGLEVFLESVPVLRNFGEHQVKVLIEEPNHFYILVVVLICLAIFFVNFVKFICLADVRYGWYNQILYADSVTSLLRQDLFLPAF